MSSRADHIAHEAHQLLQQGQLQRALATVQRGLASDPSNLNLAMAMVQVLMRTGPVEQMFYYAGRCLAMAPDSAMAVYSYAYAHATFNFHEQAITACETFLKRHPTDPQGDMLREVFMYSCVQLSRYDEMLTMAASLTGDLLSRLNLAAQVFRALMNVGRAQEGLAGLAELARRHPLDTVAAGDWCFAGNYSCTLTAPDIFEIHRLYGSAVDAMKRASPPAPPAHKPLPTASRKVRLAFISADLRDHSVAFFLEPLLAGLSRDSFEITIFQLGQKDHASRRLFDAMGAIPERWVNLNGLDMEDIATEIRSRQIDVLIELGGHSAGNTLLALARNPAPVIATWCGYPHTTGLDDVDLRFVDSLTDPAGYESQATEALIRLDPCFLCFKPGVELLDTPLAPPPCLANGFITFGSFNAITKFNPATAKLWAGAMHAAPDSRLLLKAGVFSSAHIADAIKAQITQHGIAADRIETVAFLPRRQDAMALYNRVDIALDPFPYHGTTTTCEALAMGVPVISLVGDRHAARVGLSLLSAVGLSHLAVDSPDAFAAAAARLAADPAGLATLRASLRQQLIASPLCDGAAFSKRFGDAVLKCVDAAARATL